jgi:hypothetical protein
VQPVAAASSEAASAPPKKQGLAGLIAGKLQKWVGDQEKSVEKMVNKEVEKQVGGLFGGSGGAVKSSAALPLVD